MTQPVIDFFFEFASTYSYPSAMRVAKLARAAGVAVRWRPFLLGPIFKAQGWDTSPFNLFEAKGRYMWRDMTRVCAALDLPFVRPATFPQHTVLAARLALVGLEQGWGEDFCRAVYAAEFGLGRSIEAAPNLVPLLVALGLDPAPILAAANDAPAKAALRANTDAAIQAGIFGAPSFVAGDGELFWGNDRLEAALVHAAHRIR